VLPTERIGHLSYGRRTAALRDFDLAHDGSGSILLKKDLVNIDES
jgi:hypothetical protein